MKKILLLSMCLTLTTSMVFADDGCCGWFWLRRPSTSITVNGEHGQMRFRFGHDSGYYKCRHNHHRKYKKHHHKKWKYRHDCDDCWDDDD